MYIVLPPKSWNIPKIILLREFKNYIDQLWDKLTEHIKADSNAVYKKLQRMSTTKGCGLLNHAINAFLFELHISGYQFCSPGTHLKNRLDRGDRGINPLDAVCREHDSRRMYPRILQPYCLNIHDRVIEYSPISNVVRKIMYITITERKKYPPPLFNTRDKTKILCDRAQCRKVVHHDYTNVCGSARIFHSKEICREGSGGVEISSNSLSLHLYMSYAMEFLDNVGKVLRFPAERLSPWIAMGRRDDPVQHGETPDYNGCNRCGRE
ncbi:hypothetical protein ALC57_01151 [Trachymyrmex cornetzi]|uniref:Uncharacterized protein n=1 Tax=Trachymyrmex cornetzi TaxID=471704 RepID=A0A151JQR4_9HYME|nr:hypothetical protein ALC57_01151 [Trachymyrmex cornetzi]